MASPKLKLVLLVDDDPINNFLNLSLFKKLEVAENVIVKQNGMEALNYLDELISKNHTPDLILLDLKMPVLDGYEFLEVYKELNFHNKIIIKIIALSSSNSLEDTEKINSLGFKIIEKPLNEEKIAEILNNFFSTPPVKMSHLNDTDINNLN